LCRIRKYNSLWERETEKTIPLPTFIKGAKKEIPLASQMQLPFWKGDKKTLYCDYQTYRFQNILIKNFFHKTKKHRILGKERGDLNEDLKRLPIFQGKKEGWPEHHERCYEQSWFFARMTPGPSVAWLVTAILFPATSVGPYHLSAWVE
jgi:hypothetical protein